MDVTEIRVGVTEKLVRVRVFAEMKNLYAQHEALWNTDVISFIQIYQTSIGNVTNVSCSKKDKRIQNILCLLL